MKPRFDIKCDGYILIGQSDHKDHSCDVYVSENRDYIRIVWQDKFSLEKFVDYETRMLSDVKMQLKTGNFFGWAKAAYQIGVNHLEDPSIVK